MLAHLSAYDLFVFRHGFRPAAPSAVALFVSLFLHAGLLHLAGNMLILWIYGDNVEDRLGRLPYLVAYLGSGAIASLFHMLFSLDSPLPLVGASGAISGILGFYFRWFPRNQVRLLVFLFPFLMDVIMVPARLVLGLYLLVDNVLPFILSPSGEGGVAHGAHIGGFVAGLALAWFLDRRALTGRPAEFEEQRPAGGAESAGAAIRAALRNGQFADAAAVYFSLPSHATKRLIDDSDLIEMADWLRTHGHHEAALAAYRRCLRDYATGPHAAAAHLGAGLVLLQAFGHPTPAYQHFLDALDLNPSAATAAQARAAVAAIDAEQRFPFGGRRTPASR